MLIVLRGYTTSLTTPLFSNLDTAQKASATRKLLNALQPHHVAEFLSEYPTADPKQPLADQASDEQMADVFERFVLKAASAMPSKKDRDGILFTLTDAPMNMLKLFAQALIAQYKQMAVAQSLFFGDRDPQQIAKEALNAARMGVALVFKPGALQDEGIVIQ